jgi:riboflavin kinase/FMN adenylyltransferase
MRVTRGIAEVSPARTASIAVGARSPVSSVGSGSAVTIGNFDGVHVGHQAMLARVRKAAASRGLQSCVLTFEPHPRELFAPGQAPTRLTSLREKLELLAVYGVERTHVSRFSREFAAMPAASFVDRVLIGTLGARWVLVGEDFRFGAKRGGDIPLLRDMGERIGFEVEVMPEVLHGSTRVASSAVREALRSGDLEAAQQLLGRAYAISGRVVHGDKLGRELGFATANIRLKHNRAPFTGIFAVRLHGTGAGFEAGARNGVASLGVRPTVKAAGASPLLEVHLFDFSGELYGRHVRVEFLRKIRDEEKFPDLDTLKAKIAGDCEAARKILLEMGNG